MSKACRKPYCTLYIVSGRTGYIVRSIKSLEKGLLILDAVASNPDGARVKDVSEALGGEVSNITLYLDSLVNAGYVRKDASSGKYFISRKISEIAHKAEENQFALLKQVAFPELEKLRRHFDENVLLAVLEGHDLHFITKIQSKRSIQILLNADVHYPPHVTAGGKAILAFLPVHVREKYLGDALYHRFTEKSLVNPNTLRQQLAEIRTGGYAVNHGEYENEIMAVASPIVVADEVLGSVVVQFPTFRYREESLPEFGERIRQSARAIAAAYAQPAPINGAAAAVR